MFEYKIIDDRVDPPCTTQRLNELGEKGWELCSVTHKPLTTYSKYGSCVFYFKRRIVERAG